MTRGQLCFAFCLGTFALSCNTENPATALAKRISSPTELIGGPAALGDIGDWLIANDKIRLIVQDQGFSRGFGIFGGGIIDADIVRPGATGTADRGKGRDNFGELFPALFLQAFDVQDLTLIDPVTRERTELPAIEVIADGSDGGPAILRARAKGGDFLTTVKTIVDAVVPTDLIFETDFILRPGARHVEIVGRIINRAVRSVDLSGGGIAGLLGLEGGFPLPLGDVVLFGEGNRVFAPGAVQTEENGPLRPVGFDLRFSVEASYDVPRSLPALPGLVADFMATEGPDVSYGFAIADSDSNYIQNNADEFGRDPQAPVSSHAMVVPFLVSSFTGAYYDMPPRSLAPSGEPGDRFEYRRYFIVGHGDVDSIRRELFLIRGQATGVFEGELRDALSGAPARDASIVIYDELERPYSQVDVDDDGRFRARLEPGTYHYRLLAPGRYPAPRADQSLDTTRFEVQADRSEYRSLSIDPPGRLWVQVRDSAGALLPAKVTVVRRFDPRFGDEAPIDFLFEAHLGEERRYSDLSRFDAPAQRKHEFVEAVTYTNDGLAVLDLRPTLCDAGKCPEPFVGDYDIYVSRGIEYERFVRRDVAIAPGERVQIEAVINPTVDTTDYVSADFHVHSINSADSSFALDERLRAAAGEGLEIAVATDHNFITDYQPTIVALGLDQWLTSVVGVELSTLESGHFNAFPMEYDLGSASHFPFVDVCHRPAREKVNRTAFDWVFCSPGEIFANLRSLGEFGPEQTVIQVNHPRDSILGYFGQFYMNPYLGLPEVPTSANYPAVDFISPRNNDTGQYDVEAFSFEFDAVEVFNGKRLDLLRAFRIPNDVPAPILERMRDAACGNGHPANAPGEVLLRTGGYPAFPGAVDDWMNLLNQGYRFTGTGNSDSHSADNEVGYPRNYVFVARDGGESRDFPPSRVTAIDLVDAVKRHESFATNGPFLTFSVAAGGREVGIGGDLETDGEPVELEYRLQSVDWIDVDSIRVYGNGDVLDTIAVPSGQPGCLTDESCTGTKEYTFARDTVIVVEALGNNSLFPTVLTNEVPPTNIALALGPIAAGLGLDTAFPTPDGINAPNFVQRVTPFAITNPVWVSVDGDSEFDAPGPRTLGPGPAPEEDCPEQRAMGRQLSVDPLRRIFVDPKQSGRHFEPWDIRRALHGIHAH